MVANNTECYQLKAPFELWNSVPFICKQKMYESNHRWHTHALRVHERELMHNCIKPLYSEVFDDLFQEAVRIEEDMIISLYRTGCLVLLSNAQKINIGSSSV